MKPTQSSRTVQYEAVRKSMSEAWTFVIEHPDECGEIPRVNIQPVAQQCECGDSEHTHDHAFVVTLTGMIYLEDPVEEPIEGLQL